MTTLIVPEILVLLSKASNEAERLNVLRVHDCPALREILKWQFETTPRYTYGLPEVPDYKPDVSPIGMSPSTLHVDWKKLYLYNVVNVPQLNKFNRGKARSLLIQQLEAIHESEARVLVSAFQKQLVVEGLTEAIVRKAYAGILSPTTVFSESKPNAEENDSEKTPAVSDGNDSGDVSDHSKPDPVVLVEVPEENPGVVLTSSPEASNITSKVVVEKKVPVAKKKVTAKNKSKGKEKTNAKPPAKTKTPNNPVAEGSSKGDDADSGRDGGDSRTDGSGSKDS